MGEAAGGSKAWLGLNPVIGQLVHQGHRWSNGKEKIDSALIDGSVKICLIYFLEPFDTPPPKSNKCFISIIYSTHNKVP